MEGYFTFQWCSRGEGQIGGASFFKWGGVAPWGASVLTWEEVSKKIVGWGGGRPHAPPSMGNPETLY